MPGYEEIFFGGVTAFHPPVTRLPPASSSHFSLTAATMRLLHGCPCAPQDFSRLNGFPNDHWGWGMEDDQLTPYFAGASKPSVRHLTSPRVIARTPKVVACNTGVGR